MGYFGIQCTDPFCLVDSVSDVSDEAVRESARDSKLVIVTKLQNSVHFIVPVDVVEELNNVVKLTIKGPFWRNN